MMSDTSCQEGRDSVSLAMAVLVEELWGGQGIGEGVLLPRVWRRTVR